LLESARLGVQSEEPNFSGRIDPTAAVRVGASDGRTWDDGGHMRTQGIKMRGDVIAGGSRALAGEKMKLQTVGGRFTGGKTS